MKATWMRWLVALAWLFALPAVHATITCTTITSPGVSINYTSNTTASVQTYFTVACTRTSTSDPTSVSYDVTADNGMTGARQINQAALGTSLIKYDFYTDAACSVAWTGKGKISDTISWGSTTGTISRQTSYWGCIVTKQTPSSSGDYTDSVKLTLKYAGGQTITGTASVDIYAPANCTLSRTGSSSINISYAAFGAQKTGNASFTVNCTNGMPYSVATDVTEAVLVGLRYTLTLNATSANGTGAPQTITITATIPAGQAGTCPAGTCSGTNTHTLTISY